LLVKSGYDLESNYESEKINNFKLPEVHREIGPEIALTVFWLSPSPSSLTLQPFGKIFPSASAKNS
jgi:hypothetical protein